MKKKIIALELEQVDDLTGAVAKYHTIDYYAVDFRANICTATFNGYVSKQTKEEGKQPLVSHTTNLFGLPETPGDFVQWAYEQVLKPASEDGLEMGLTGNTHFAGASPVYEGGQA